MACGSFGNPFLGCTSLRTLDVEEGSPYYHAEGNCIIESATNCISIGCNYSEIPSYAKHIGEGAFCNLSFEKFVVPEGIVTIEKDAFNNSFYLKEVTLPSTLTKLDVYAFYACLKLKTLKVKMKSPIAIASDTFTETALENLYVPAGTKELYEAADGWKNIKNIIEMEDLDPIDNGTTIDIGTQINTDTNLDGNVVGNILYNISSGNGEFNPDEHCIVLNKPVSDETMSNLEGKDVFGEDFKDQFTGIVFKVAKGSGNIKVEVLTSGNMVLKVKIGNNTPTEVIAEEKTTKTIPYNVTEETYVYIYGSTKAAQQAKGMRRANGTDGTLKIFGIEIEKNPTAIDDIFADDKPMDIYTLSGQKVRSGATSLQGLPAGVYIVGGKKVVVSK